jgi:hypothetical protein
MFCMLVVVLSPDHVTGLGFRTGKCHILLIGSLRVLDLGSRRAAFDVHRFERPGDGTGPDRRARMVRFEPFFMAHSLVVAGVTLMRPTEDDKPRMLSHPHTHH